MRLPDNYFRERTPAEIIAKVATITLGNISLLGSEELKRIGWLDNPIIDILYSLTSAGVWIARTDASGQVKIIESNSTVIDANGVRIGSMLHPIVGAAITSRTNLPYAQRRIAQIPLTEAAGSIAATAIVPGIASYKAHCIIKGIWAPTGTTDAANTWTVSTEGGGGITGPAVHAMAITANRTHFLSVGAAGSGEGTLVYNTTADKDILLSAADLAAVGTTYYVEVEYWYEA